jgi:hypothetical protein
MTLQRSKSRPLILSFLACAIFLFAYVSVQAQPSRASRGSTVTGTYSIKNPSTENTLEAQVLPGGRVKIHLYASWIGSVSAGQVNTGELKEILPLKNRIAVYESNGCRITIRFAGHRAKVQQTEREGGCGFGLNVSASGTYRKRSRRVPKFDF